LPVNERAARVSGFLGRFLLCAAVVILGAWTYAAFWFRLDAPFRWPALALAAGTALAIIVLGRRRPRRSHRSRWCWRP
jgi:heme A synthase